MIRVGTAGWSYPDWEGVVYPRRKPPGFHALAYLARFVDCVEINSTFYSLPRAEHAAHWARLVEPRPSFRFTAKLHRDWTHGPPLSDASEAERLAEEFSAGIEPLQATGRLAALLVQLPASFRDAPSARERLAHVEARFEHLPLVVELRHRSWFTPDALRWLERTSYSLAAIDLSPSPDHPPAEHATPGRIGYVRVHGRNAKAWFDPRAGRDEKYDYLYSSEELDEIERMVERVVAESEDTYVVTNNHYAGKALVNAIELLARLGSTPPLAPAELIATYPRVAAVARVEGQQMLF